MKKKRRKLHVVSPLSAQEIRQALKIPKSAVKAAQKAIKSVSGKKK